MSLDQAKIVSNAKKYFDTAQKYGFMTDSLISFLGEDFIKAPASTMSSYHNAFEGGLIDHLLLTTKYAVSINDSLPEDEKADKASLIKVCCLHQIGKGMLYKINPSEWHRKTLGKMYEFNNENLTSMRVGERSIYYAISHGITFLDEEYIAILNFDKNDDRQSEFHNTMLGELLKMGSILAIKHEIKTAKQNA